MRGEDRPRLSFLRACCAALVVAGLLAGAGRAAAPALARGDPAARLPAGAFGGDYWDLVARFDSGHAILASAALTNLGLGQRHATVVGLVVDPDGQVHPFSRSETPGAFQLSDDGRRLDLRSIVLDQRGAERRLVVDKDELEIDLVIGAGGPPAWSEASAAPGCAVDVLEAGGRVAATLWRPDLPKRLVLRGRAALTHRWMTGLESHCARRSLELFAAQGDLALYYNETLPPSGAPTRWLVAQRAGRTLYQGPPDASTVEWGAGAEGFPEPVSLRFTAPGLSGRFAFAAPLGVFEPLERLPAPVRWALAAQTRPRLVWSAPRFELAVGRGAKRRTLSGLGLAKLAYTNPLPAREREAARSPTLPDGAAEGRADVPADGGP